MTTENSQKPKTKSKRQRSPNYPYYSLKACIDYLAKFVEKNKGFAEAHMDYAAQHIGFSSNSNRAQSAISSMLGYGIFESKRSEGNRYFYPSELAKKIYQNQDGSQDAIALLRKAALFHPETKKVWSHYKENLPGRGTLEKWLMAERNYSQRGASRFAYVVVETYEFAQLKDRAIIEPIEEELADFADTESDGEPEESGSIGNEVREDPPSGFTDYPIPIDRGKRHVILRAPSDLTEQDFDYIVQWIELIKVGLAKKDK